MLPSCRWPSHPPPLPPERRRPGGFCQAPRRPPARGPSRPPGACAGTAASGRSPFWAWPPCWPGGSRREARPVPADRRTTSLRLPGTRCRPRRSGTPASTRTGRVTASPRPSPSAVTSTSPRAARWPRDWPPTPRVPSGPASPSCSRGSTCRWSTSRRPSPTGPARSPRTNSTSSPRPERDHGLPGCRRHLGQ